MFNLPLELIYEIYDFSDIETKIRLNVLYKFKLNKKFIWKSIKNINLSEKFIKEFDDKLFTNNKNKIKYTNIQPKGYYSIFNWIRISEQKFLSENFIKEFQNKIKFKRGIEKFSYKQLTMNHIFSENFLIEFQYIFSNEFVRYCRLENFIRQHIKKLNLFNKKYL
jgi:hypothetical protein